METKERGKEKHITSTKTKSSNPASSSSAVARSADLLVLQTSSTTSPSQPLSSSSLNRIKSVPDQSYLKNSSELQNSSPSISTKGKVRPTNSVYPANQNHGLNLLNKDFKLSAFILPKDLALESNAKTFKPLVQQVFKETILLLKICGDHICGIADDSAFRKRRGERNYFAYSSSLIACREIMKDVLKLKQFENTPVVSSGVSNSATSSPSATPIGSRQNSSLSIKSKYLYSSLLSSIIIGH
jgi:hypothetical protein